MKYTLLALVLSAAVTEAACFVDGKWTDGNSSFSVTTNAGPTIREHITNRTFTSGIGGWSATENSISHVAASNALYCAAFSDGNPLEIKFTYSPPVTGTNTATIYFRYFFTNTDEHSVKWRTVDVDGGTASTLNSAANSGNGTKTLVSAIIVPGDGVLGGFNGTNFWLELVTAGDTAHIFFDYFSVSSSVAGATYTTTSVEAVRGTLMVNPSFVISNNLVYPQVSQ